MESRLLLAADAFSHAQVGSMQIEGAWFDVVPASNTFKFQQLRLNHGPIGPAVPHGSIVNAVDRNRYIVQLSSTSDAPQSVHAADYFFQNLVEADDVAATRVVRGLGQPGLVLVETLERLDRISTWFAKQPSVEYFELDGSVTVDECEADCPDDPTFEDQQNTLDAVGVSSLWGHSQGSATVVVGVMDTGIDYTHPDIAQNIWLNQGEIPMGLRSALVDSDEDGRITFYDLNATQNSDLVLDQNLNGFIDAEDILQDPLWENGLDEDGNGFRDDLVGWDFEAWDNEPFDEHAFGHGTHVAGIIAAQGNNHVAATGINWRSSIVPVRVLDSTNRGSVSTVIAGFEYLTGLRQDGVPIRVANSSFTGADFSQALQSSVEHLASSDVLLVVAAGNGDSQRQGFSLDVVPRYPASYDADNMLAVAATNLTGDGLAAFSNFGDCFEDRSGGCSVDIAAPGLDIVSLRSGATDAVDATVRKNGTSMAAPHVAGVAALLFALEPTASAADIHDSIMAGANRIGSLELLVGAGGTLNAQAAFDTLRDAPTALLVQASTVKSPADQVQIEVHYSADDLQTIDPASIARADLIATREGFSSISLKADFQHVEMRGRNFLARYTVEPPESFGSEIREAGQWHAVDNGIYTLQIPFGQIRTFSGAVNRETSLEGPGGLPSFSVAIDDSTVEVIRNAEPLDFAELEPQINTLVLSDGIYGLNSQQVLLGRDMHVLGAGAEQTVIDATQQTRIFDIGGNTRLHLEGITLQNGTAVSGGAIRNSGTLILQQAALRNNSADLQGGAIWSSGTLKVMESTLDANSVTDRGGIGGGAIYSTGTLTVDRSTLSRNTSLAGVLAGSGGGAIYHSGESATILRSTISGNVTEGDGGAIYHRGGGLNINHATVVYNTAGNAVGGVSSNEPFTLSNSIVSLNSARFGSGNVSIEQTGASKTNLIDQDPKIGPLQHNGGITETHRLLSDSSAIGIVVEDVSSRASMDQRGFHVSTQSAGAVQRYFAEVRGHLFQDADGDGDRHANEAPLAEWIVYADTNGNREFDAGEPYTVTQVDDPSTQELDESAYVLAGIDPTESTSVPIRAVPKHGFVESSPVVLETVWDVVEVIGSSDPIFPSYQLSDTTAAEFSGLGEVEAAAFTRSGPLLENGRRPIPFSWKPSDSGGLVVLDQEQPELEQPEPGQQDQPAIGQGGSHTIAAWLRGNSLIRGGEWFHVAKTFENGDVITYINSISNASSSEFNADLALIRGNGGFVADYVQFDTALSPQAIDDLRQHGVPQDLSPVFHLDFSMPVSQLRDVSGNDLEIAVGAEIQTNSLGGPKLAGRDTALDSGVWQDVNNHENQIDILDSPRLDSVSRSAGSIATWVKVADDNDWNNIVITQQCPELVSTARPCAPFSQVLEPAGSDIDDVDGDNNQRTYFDETRGIEIQADRHHLGTVAGSAQGWATQSYGPASEHQGRGNTETPTGEWTHIALTWNARGDHTTFVNGVPGAVVLGGGSAEFGRNNPGIWTIGGDALDELHFGDGPPTDESGACRVGTAEVPLLDENCRRLHGELADFAIFDGELDRATVNQIITQGVASLHPQGSRGFESFDADPLVVGERIVFEDHLGRLFLSEDDSTLSLVGLDEGNSSLAIFADGNSIAYDGEFVAFSGRETGAVETGDVTTSIYRVNKFGAVETLVTPLSMVTTTDGQPTTPFATEDATKSLTVHSILDGNVLFGAKERDEKDASGRVLQEGRNRTGIYLSVTTDLIVPIVENDLAFRSQLGEEYGQQFEARQVSFGDARQIDNKFTFLAEVCRSGCGAGERPRTGFVFFESTRGELQTLFGDQHPANDMNLRQAKSFDFWNEQLAFHGVGAEQQGVYLAAQGDALQMIADTNTNVPGGVGKFTSFGEVGFDSGNIVFVGRGDSRQLGDRPGVYKQQGIYVWRDGHTSKIVDLHGASQLDAFAGRSPISLSIGREAINGNRIVFHAAFADGSDGVFSVVFDSTSEHVVEVAAGQVVDGVDFGRRPLTGQIAGQVFSDTNGNRLLDPGEVFQAGWTVVLNELDRQGELVADGVAQVQTDSGGSYLFDGLPSLANYSVRVVPQEGSVVSSPSERINLNANASVTNINFATRDSVVQGDDLAANSIEVSILGNGGDGSDASHLLDSGSLVLRSTDDASSATVREEISSGHAVFDDLRVGQYEVQLELSPPFEQTFPLVNDPSFHTIGSVGDGPSAVVMRDFTGDGRDDAVVSNFNDNSLSLIIDVLGRMPRVVPIALPAGDVNPIAVVSDDFDLDGKPDLAVLSHESGTVSIYTNDAGELRYVQTSQTDGRNRSIESRPIRLSVIDANNDAAPDLAIVNSGLTKEARSISVLVNNAGVFQSEFVVPTEGKPVAIDVADLDGVPGEEVVTVVRSNQTGDVVRVIDPRTAETLFETRLQNADRVAVGHFNGDEHADIAVSNRAQLSVNLLFGEGGVSFTDPAEHVVSVPTFFTSIAAADVNRDGRDDLVALTAAPLSVGQPPVLALVNDGEAGFVSSSVIGQANLPQGIGAQWSLDETALGDSFALANYEQNSVTIQQNRFLPGSQIVSLNASSSLSTVRFQTRLLGDADSDGQVGFSDFLVISTNFARTNALWSDGDFTRDGIVDFADFLLFTQYFGIGT